MTVIKKLLDNVERNTGLSAEDKAKFDELDKLDLESTNNRNFPIKEVASYIMRRSLNLLQVLRRAVMGRNKGMAAAARGQKIHVADKAEKMKRVLLGPAGGKMDDQTLRDLKEGKLQLVHNHGSYCLCYVIPKV